MASVNPRTHLLDYVLKGVQVAADVYGIKQQSDRNDAEAADRKTALQAATEEKSALRAATAADKNAAREDKKGDRALSSARDAETARYHRAMEGNQRTAIAARGVTKPDFSPKDEEKTGGTFADKINPNRGRSGEMGKTQARINAGGRVLGLALDEKTGEPRALTKGEMTELSVSVGSLISNGGVASQHVIDSMTPSSLAGDTAAQWSYITNEVNPADQREFVARLAGTAKREIEIAGQQKAQAQEQALPEFNDWRNRNPQKWAATLKAAGLNPDDYDEYSLRKDPQSATKAPPSKPTVSGFGVANAADGGGQAPAHPQDAAAVKWAQSNLLSKDPATYQKAMAILQANGIQAGGK